jgi:hypothetical protein
MMIAVQMGTHGNDAGYLIRSDQYGRSEASVPRSHMTMVVAVQEEDPSFRVSCVDLTATQRRLLS